MTFSPDIPSAPAAPSSYYLGQASSSNVAEAAPSASHPPQWQQQQQQQLPAQGIPAMSAQPSLPPQVVHGLHEWSAATHRIRALENEQVESQSASAEAALRAATQAAQAKQAEVSCTARKVHKDECKAAKADDPFFLKKILFASKCEEKAAKRHAELERDAKALELRNASLQHRTAEQQRTAAVAAQLRSKVAELQGTRQQEAAMVESLFASAYSPLADGREGQLRAAVAALQPQLAAMEEYKCRYTTALQHLAAANNNMQQAASLLGSALGIANFDIMEDMFVGERGYGGMMTNVIEQQQCSAGVAMARAAMGDLERARALCPDVPRIDLRNVQDLDMALAVFDMMFDNIFMDIMVQQRIQSSYGKVRAMLDDIGFAMRWMESTLTSRIAADHASLVSQMAVARTNLANHRRHLIYTTLLRISPGPAARTAQPPPAGGQAACGGASAPPMEGTTMWPGPPAINA